MANKSLCVFSALEDSHYRANTKARLGKKLGKHSAKNSEAAIQEAADVVESNHKN